MSEDTKSHRVCKRVQVTPAKSLQYPGFTLHLKAEYFFLYMFSEIPTKQFRKFTDCAVISAQPFSHQGITQKNPMLVMYFLFSVKQCKDVREEGYVTYKNHYLAAKYKRKGLKSKILFGHGRNKDFSWYVSHRGMRTHIQLSISLSCTSPVYVPNMLLNMWSGTMSGLKPYDHMPNPSDQVFHWLK